MTMPANVQRIDVLDIKVDPERFQFKTGTGKGGAGQILRGKKWNPEYAGVIQVWKEPKTGITWVINGHNRLELAKETGQEQIDVRFINAKNAAEARVVGAKTNMAEGRGSAVDAAKVFRETSITLEDLENQGLSIREKIVADGMALANLDNSLFSEVVRGDIPLNRGVTIGRELEKHEDQVALVKLLEKTNKRLNEAEVTELISFVKSAGKVSDTQQTLFGAETVTKSSAIEKAQLSAYIKDRLSKDRKLFGYISKETRAARISQLGVGNIDTGASSEIATNAAILEEVFKKQLKYKGPISEALNESASELAQGGNLNEIRERLYRETKKAVSQIVKGSETQGAIRSEVDAGQRIPSTIQQGIIKTVLFVSG